MLKAYKYRIYPSKKQKTLLAKHFGCCRFIYNWALEQKIKYYQDNQKGISIFELANKLPDLKKNDYPWLKEVNSQALQSSLINLDRAFTNFFKHNTDFPKFKSKKNHQSFQCVQKCSVDFDSNKLFIPKFKNGIKTKFHRKFEGKIKTVTISKTPSEKYFVSILVDSDNELSIKQQPKESEAIGIDLGIKDFATLSNGEKIKNPKHLKWKQRKLKKEQKKLSKKKKGSNNRNKQRIKVAKQHEKIVNCRKDFLHKITSKLVRDNQTICIENLRVKNLLKNKKENRNCSRKEEKMYHQATLDVGWGMFRQFLDYKCQWYGKNLKIIGRFEASSKTCSCGKINNNLTLQDRKWTCESCGKTHDRDVLAANNIKKFAFREQNTNSVPSERGEFTPVEIRGTRSTKQEAAML